MGRTRKEFIANEAPVVAEEDGHVRRADIGGSAESQGEPGLVYQLVRSASVPRFHNTTFAFLLCLVNYSEDCQKATAAFHNLTAYIKERSGNTFFPSLVLWDLLCPRGHSHSEPGNEARVDITA